MVDESDEDFSEMINAATGDGWITAMGLKIVRATRNEVVAEMVLGPQHMQAYGIVHGGVHSGIVETLASVGAAIHAMPAGKNVVGLENNTSFLRAVRGGKLHAVAKPLTRGRRSHVWEVAISDQEGRLVASGRVRLLLLEPDAEVAGERVKLGS